MSELTNWLMVFLRASAMLAVFPIFSARNFPVQLRLALGALLAGMVAATLPADAVQAADFWGLAGQMAVEVGMGLVIGFACRMIFFALEIAGSIISAEIGLSMPPGINPLSDAPMTTTATILYYLAAMLWLSMDMHHWMLIGFQEDLQCICPLARPIFPRRFVTDMSRAPAGFSSVGVANGGAAAGRFVHYFAGFRRAGPGGAADECVRRKLCRAAAGRD
jgi:flagellar biosynthetic protein FliR